MDSTLEQLREHLRDNAPRYYPELGVGEVRVHCRGSRVGPLSSVHRFGLRSAARERRVVVKLPPASGRVPATRRPRVVPLLDPDTKQQGEHAALVALEQHFGERPDPRFGFVRVLDFVEPERAVVMEETPGRPLSRLVAGAHRLRRPLGSRRLEAVFANTGAWLRAYHDLPALAHTRARNASREEFDASVQRLVGYLARTHPGDARLAAAATCAGRLAAVHLPERLPLGTSHGDLAPRNVLVEPDGRVTVLDTRAAWRAPIYEDIAYFLTAAKTPRAQAASLGLALGQTALGRLERAFLAGYFGADPVPIERVRLFELQSLLDKWASKTEARERHHFGLSHVAGRYRDWSVDRLLHRSVAGVLRQLEPSGAAA